MSLRLSMGVASALLALAGCSSKGGNIPDGGSQDGAAGTGAPLRGRAVATPRSRAGAAAAVREARVATLPARGAAREPLARAWVEAAAARRPAAAAAWLALAAMVAPPFTRSSNSAFRPPRPA